jgi:uncharacterized membrane-anchored protein
VTARQFKSALVLGLFALVGLTAPAVAQQANDLEAQFAALKWQDGPSKGALGTIATISVPQGYKFLGSGDARKFMELNQNPTDGSEMGVLLNSENGWFVVFEFSDDGYVKDDDRSLDADAIIASIREGTAAANDVRRQRGWPTIEVLGWEQKPFYDSKTNNLTWSILGASEGSMSVNHSTRLLGRRGVMKLNLVMDQKDIPTAVPAFNTLVTDFSFNPGQRYAEFTRGDKVAEYGLAGLIVGGTGVALVKSGFLQKFWKVIVLGFVALAGAAKRLLGGLFGRGESASADQPSNV